MLDAFHVTKLGTDAVDQVRRRVQQTIHGHRGRKGDPLYGIRLDPALRRRAAHRQADGPARRRDRRRRTPRRGLHRLAVSPTVAGRLQGPSLTEGRRIAEKVLASFPTCPIPDIRRLGRTLRQWQAAFLAYFTTARASNGGTEAINGLIEVHRRIARGFRNRDNYRLRMLLIGGGLDEVIPT